jgi:hypothetical protein
MSDNFYRGLRFAIPIGLILWALLIWLALTLADPHKGELRWDQESLKVGDRGCPTAIYTAPNGELKQCP